MLQGDRVNAPNIVVVMTDGFTEGQLQPAVDKAHSKGVHLLTVTYEDVGDADNIRQLSSGNKDNVFLLDDYTNEHLVAASFAAKIRKIASSKTVLYNDMHIQLL